jgi:TPR repeat protein
MVYRKAANQGDSDAQSRLAQLVSTDRRVAHVKTEVED